MKVLLVHNYYQQLGGERVAVQAQVDLLARRGHQVMLYTRDSTAIRDYGLMEKARFFPHTVYAREVYSEVRQLIKRERPGVAHVHNVFPLISPAVYYALRDAGIPIVQTLHNFRFMCPNGLFYTHGTICERCKHGNTLHAVRLKCYHDSYLLSALYALSIGWARQRGTLALIDRFIALNPFVAGKIVESGIASPDRVTVVENYLPGPLPAHAPTLRREQYFLYLGRLSPEKGIDMLIEAMAALPQVQLKIAGDGPQAQALRDRVDRYALHNVKFLGRVEGEAKWALLRAARAVVVPSLWYENQPYSVLESMGASTPIIAARQGGLPYLVDDGNSGLLFRPGDAGDLAEKLQWLAARPDQSQAMGIAARATLERRFSEDAHYQGLLAIYNQLLAHKET
jgi:glycosyltransferase involved in cell wall biosynthesis